MPGDGDDGAAVSFGRLQPLVEPADVRVAIGLESHCAGGGFDEAPLEIVVDVAAGSAVADASVGGDFCSTKPGPPRSAIRFSMACCTFSAFSRCCASNIAIRRSCRSLFIMPCNSR